MNSYLDELNEVQRNAVTNTEGPVLVIAGPGSGKTRVLTYRIAHLIKEGAAPWEVLALTFTNKSAREMKDRISKVVGDKANQIWAGTFHSIFARILRVEASKIGYPSSFTIYDSDDSKSVIKSVLKELNLDPKVYAPNGIRSRISSAKSNLISPAAYEADADLRSQDRMSRRPHLYQIYKKYAEKCRNSGAMDFDDLLYQLYILLHKNQDNVCEKYQQRFKYVLVDEFQDTNFLQYSIIKKLVTYPSSPRNICVVGDDAQSIYGFRGATIDNILDFEKEFKGLQIFKLEQNYRSTSHIVEAANEVIQNNKKQIQKKIWSDKGEGQKISLVKTQTDNEEGKRVADKITELKNRNHLKNKEIAILYRTNAQSRIFEEYLRRYNLNYRVFGGLSFYQRKEVKDLIGYLRMAVNSTDEEALKRVINFPKRGIGKSSFDKIADVAAANNLPIWECLLAVDIPKKAKGSIFDFVQKIKHFQGKVATMDAYDLALEIYKDSGLFDYMKIDKTVEGLNRMENVTALLDGIKDFVENDEVRIGEEVNDKSLTSYIQNIALLTDMDDDKSDDDRVTLMSVHSAKGLEFKSVFVVGLEENLFPSFMSMESQEGLDEERRLFYVAITRAEQFLTLSFAKQRYKFGKSTYNNPSRFLTEIPEEHMDASLHSVIGGGGRDSDGPVRASVSGNFKRSVKAAPALMIDPADFKPSPSSTIEAGMEVLHMKFGKGKVVKIDGGAQNRVATIHFPDIDNSERRLMLKFAKLQIV